MVETGGTKSGEPFDLDAVFDLNDKIAKLLLARAIMGDAWVKENITNGEDTEIYLAKLTDKRKEAMRILRDLAKRCICPPEGER